MDYNQRKKRRRLILDMIEQGKTAREIADATGCSIPYPYTLARREDLELQLAHPHVQHAGTLRVYRRNGWKCLQALVGTKALRAAGLDKCERLAFKVEGETIILSKPQPPACAGSDVPAVTRAGG